MKNSEQINELAVALNKAQADFMVAKKDAKNPFFKSKYATLNAVYEAVAEALLKNGLSVIQPIVGDAVETTLVHTSGQFITSACPIVCAKQNDPQAMGSAITYARRYSLASLLGVMTDDDDDGEKAMARPAPKQSVKEAPKAEKKQEKEPETPQCLLKLKAFREKLNGIKDGSIDMSKPENQKKIQFVSDLKDSLISAGYDEAAELLEKDFNKKLFKGM
jgi:hypothetical protein